MSDTTVSGDPSAVPVSANPYNTYGLATQGFVLDVIDAAARKIFGRVKTVNGVSPDLSGNLELSSIRSVDYSGGVDQVNSDLTVLRGGVPDVLLTLSDYKGISGDFDSRIDAISADCSACVASVSSASGDWESAYSTVSSASGDWNSVYTTVMESSGGWENPASPEKLDSVYSTVEEASGGWCGAQASVSSASGDWNSVYSTVQNASGGWSEAYTWTSSAGPQCVEAASMVNASSGAWNGAAESVVSISQELPYKTTQSDVADIVNAGQTGWTCRYSHDGDPRVYILWFPPGNGWVPCLSPTDVGTAQGAPHGSLSSTELVWLPQSEWTGEGTLSASRTLIYGPPCKEDVSNKVQSITSESTEQQYPSAKCVWDSLPYAIASPQPSSGTVTLVDRAANEVSVVSQETSSWRWYAINGIVLHGISDPEPWTLDEAYQWEYNGEPLLGPSPAPWDGSIQVYETQNEETFRVPMTFTVTETEYGGQIRGDISDGVNPPVTDYYINVDPDVQGSAGSEYVTVGGLTYDSCRFWSGVPFAELSVGAVVEGEGVAFSYHMYAGIVHERGQSVSEIGFPTAVQGRSRDFTLSLSMAQEVSSAPSLPSQGVAFVPSTPSLSDGSAIRFTEIEEGTFLVTEPGRYLTEHQDISGKADASALSAVSDRAESAYSLAYSVSGGLSRLDAKVPEQTWNEGNELADNAFVNSSVQSSTANFRGNWPTWASVPSVSSGYDPDYTGSTMPTVNDYMVVQEASGYPSAGEAHDGTWRFKYTGSWAASGKDGWRPEYQVNETPFTANQLAAINSGITETLVGEFEESRTRIYGSLGDRYIDGDGDVYTGTPVQTSYWTFIENPDSGRDNGWRVEIEWDGELGVMSLYSYDRVERSALTVGREEFEGGYFEYVFDGLESPEFEGMTVTGIYREETTYSWSRTDSLATTSEVSAIGTEVAALESASGGWDSSASKVSTDSWMWDSAYEMTNEGFANWNSTTLTVSEGSESWDSATSTVSALSGGWANATAKVGSSSGEWDWTHSAVSASSGSWNTVSNRLNSWSAAPVFSLTATYPMGCYVTYDGDLYYCEVAKTESGGQTPDQDIFDAETASSNHWRRTDMTSPDATLNITDDGALEVVSDMGERLWIQGYGLNLSSTDVLANETVQSYSFSANATDEVLLTLPEPPDGKVGDLILDVRNPPLDSTAPDYPSEFSTASTYSVGDLVSYSDSIWGCTSEVTAAGSWSGSTNWAVANPSFGISGLDSSVCVVVPKGEGLAEILTAEPGSMFELYFTMTSFELSGLPTWKVVRQDVENGGAVL